MLVVYKRNLLYSRCQYDMTVNVEYTKEVVVEDTQIVQCLVPGSPSSPEIWTRSVGNTEFVIEWGEPRLYGIKVRGYQVYMNDKKVGNTLHAHHRKAVIPCRPRRYVLCCYSYILLKSV